MAAGCVVRERAYAPDGSVSVDATAVDSGVYVDSAPPPPVEETITAAPDPAFVWIGGVWIWGGHGWRWERGHWSRPPRVGAVWIPHHYVYRNGRHVFVRGGWR